MAGDGQQGGGDNGCRPRTALARCGLGAFSEMFYGATSFDSDLSKWETGNVIVERFKDLNPLDFPAVLVNRHAPFTWGKTVAKAVEVASTHSLPASSRIEMKVMSEHHDGTSPETRSATIRRMSADAIGARIHSANGDRDG